MKNLMSLFFLMAISVQLNAQHCIIKGKVFSKDDNHPVFNALVMSLDSTFSANTDINGKFKISLDKPGIYNLRIGLFPHYSDTIIENINTGNKKRIKLDAGLEIVEIKMIEGHYDKKCPVCGSEEFAIPVEYGLITSEMAKRQEERKCVLMGCLVSSYNWFCSKCKVIY
jgi:hypothetical protein